MREALLCVLMLSVSAATATPGIVHDFAEVHAAQIDGTLYRVWELSVTSPRCSWTNTRLEISLDQGTMYQHPLGGNTEPDSAVATNTQNLQWDTYVTVPGGRIETLIFAGAETMNETEIRLSWGAIEWSAYPARHRLAQITLSDDAEGTVSGRSWDCLSDGIGFPIEGWRIEGGRFVPEPTTLGLLAVGAGALFRRR